MESHHRRKRWSEKNKLSPRQVMRGSHKECWFDCDKCKHSFNSIPHSITRSKKPSWCSFCSKPPKQLCTDDNCEMCFNNSLASFISPKLWSKKNIKSPRQIFKHARSEKVWIICDRCPHEFDVIPEDLTGSNKLCWCPFCSVPPKRLCEDNCEACFNKSLASIIPLELWSEKNLKHPKHIFKHAQSEKVWIICNECSHEFDVIPGNLTSETPTWCPLCKNKTEKKLYGFLEKVFPAVIFHKRFDWCYSEETKRQYEFDYYIESYDIIIELDGPQHFFKIMNWKGPELTRHNDILKMNLSLSHNISVLRLCQSEIYSSHFDQKAFDHFVKSFLHKKEIPILELISDNENVYNCYEKEIMESDYFTEGVIIQRSKLN
jgi:cytochrome b involved in lipid metabolism